MFYYVFLFRARYFILVITFSKVTLDKICNVKSIRYHVF